jgi:Xaa-Pro aminopeptidase
MSVPVTTPAGLPAIDHAVRRRSITTMVETRGHGCDAVLYTDLTDVRWLSGFSGSNGWALIRGGELVVGTDGRYGDRARAETAGSGATVIVETRPQRLYERLVEALVGATRVGLDSSTTSHREWLRLADDLSLEHLDSFVKVQRQIKNVAEIARIERAAGAADAALAEVEPLVLAAADEAVTEADIRDELEYRMRMHGADDRSYATIVAAGPDNAARPHHEVSRRDLRTGDTVIIDVGALVDGYHSDMTRSYVVGPPTARQMEIYDLVAASQQAGLDAVGVGVGACDVDRACRAPFEDAGFGDWFVHGTGHGVGLDIHETPFLSVTGEAVLVEGNVVTVEPGLYRGGFGGFRIEDLVVVTGDGHRVLTHTPKRSLSTTP